MRIYSGRERSARLRFLIDGLGKSVVPERILYGQLGGLRRALRDLGARHDGHYDPSDPSLGLHFRQDSPFPGDLEFLAGHLGVKFHESQAAQAPVSAIRKSTAFAEAFAGARLSPFIFLALPLLAFAAGLTTWLGFRLIHQEETPHFLHTAGVTILAGCVTTTFYLLVSYFSLNKDLNLFSAQSEDVKDTVGQLMRWQNSPSFDPLSHNYHFFLHTVAETVVLLLEIEAFVRSRPLFFSIFETLHRRTDTLISDLLSQSEQLKSLVRKRAELNSIQKLLEKKPWGFDTLTVLVWLADSVEEKPTGEFLVRIKNKEIHVTLDPRRLTLTHGEASQSFDRRESRSGDSISLSLLAPFRFRKVAEEALLMPPSSLTPSQFDAVVWALNGAASKAKGARAAVNPPADQKFLLFTASLTVLQSLLFLGTRAHITFFHEHFMSQPFIVRWSEQTGSWILALWVVTSVAIVIRNQNSIGKSTASRGARLATPAASNGARLAIRVDELEDSGLRTDLEHCGIKFIYSTDESNSRISGRGALVRTVHTTKELIALRVRSDLWPAFLKLLESAVRYGGVEAVYIDPSASV